MGIQRQSLDDKSRSNGQMGYHCMLYITLNVLVCILKSYIQKLVDIKVIPHNTS